MKNIKFLILSILLILVASCKLYYENSKLPELLMLKQTIQGTTSKESTTSLQVTYPDSSSSLIYNIDSIVSLTPTVTEAITDCTVSPALPEGFTIDSTTCGISGTPTTAQAPVSYTITASNSSGNATTIISITISGWVHEAYLKASNGEGTDQFGYSAAISADTIVVGATNESSNQTTITNGTTASADNSAGNSGAAYVFKRTGTTWVQEAYLKAPNANGGDQFGINVSISGDTIVVGAWQEDSNQTTITNGTTASSDNSLSASGAAYVFKRTGSIWAQEAYLKAPNAGGSDYFGLVVSISEDTIVVGAPYEDSNQTTITNGTTASADNSAGSSGAAYVFKRTGTTWAQEAYLKAPNADGSDGGDFFGSSVSISGDTIVVGAWREDSNQTTITNGTTATGDNSRLQSGAAYVFKRTGSTWAQEAYLKAPNAGGSDNFGRSVSISTDTIVVGAYGEDSNQTAITNGTTASTNNSAGNSGAAYVFRRY